MSSYTYAPFDPTPLYLGEFPAFSRSISIAAGAGVLPRGTVLGLVTSTGNFVTSVAAASDGSQSPRAVLACDVDASAGAVTAPAYFTGKFASEQLTYGAAHSISTVNAAFITAGQSIFVQSVGTVA